MCTAISCLLGRSSPACKASPPVPEPWSLSVFYMSTVSVVEVTTQQQQCKPGLLSLPCGPLSAGHHFYWWRGQGSDSHCLSHPHRMAGPTAGYSVSRSSLPPAPSPRVAGSPFLCFFVSSCLLRADVISLIQALRHRLCVSVIHLVFMLHGCSIAFGDEGAEPRATSPCLSLWVSVLFICRV